MDGWKSTFLFRGSAYFQGQTVEFLRCNVQKCPDSRLASHSLYIDVFATEITLEHLQTDISVHILVPTHENLKKKTKQQGHG